MRTRTHAKPRPLHESAKPAQRLYSPQGASPRPAAWALLHVRNRTRGKPRPLHESATPAQRLYCPRGASPRPAAWALKITCAIAHMESPVPSMNPPSPLSDCTAHGAPRPAQPLGRYFTCAIAHAASPAPSRNPPHLLSGCTAHGAPRPAQPLGRSNSRAQSHTWKAPWENHPGVGEGGWGAVGPRALQLRSAHRFDEKDRRAVQREHILHAPTDSQGDAARPGARSDGRSGRPSGGCCPSRPRPAEQTVA